MAKQSILTVKDANIRTMTVNGIDYICITDIARQKNAIDPNGVIGNWIRNRNTIEFLGLWETLYNPNFNPLEFEGVRRQAGLNAFTLSATQWIEATNATGLIAKAGRYGGTYETMGEDVFYLNKELTEVTYHFSEEDMKDMLSVDYDDLNYEFEKELKELYGE